MPPCKSVLLKKIERTQYLSQMIKKSTDNYIVLAEKGWLVDENQEMEIEYFSGNPFPDTIANIRLDDSGDDSEKEEDICLSSDDESDLEDGCDDDSDEEWKPS